MAQHDYQPGQRWISNTELQLGLGTVLGVEHRTVQIVFLATGETRTYARQSAPLSRVHFSAGDRVRSNEGWLLSIDNIEEHDGLLFYIGRREDGSQAILPESQLDNFIQLNRPADRLLTAQIDSPKLYSLRQETRRHLSRLASSELYGLIGTRTNLIPHQLYIAEEVSRRYAPRVLLADEVGLGKTIEAGLIIHRQLLTERAQRVLIVVPESLIHQWLVEMLRRFNLYFSIFDEARCAAQEESNPQDNPFESEQLILCSLSFLCASEARFAQVLSCDWDLLVVDEAHHLQWSPAQQSPEYRCIEQLAAATRGVLLLTATPEQLGKSGHYARLRLLDPDRFPDFQRFVEEEAHYAPIAEAVENLMEKKPLHEASYALLRSTLNEGDNQRYLDELMQADTSAEQREYARSRLIEHLLDRHGTGRVLFRNTRHAVKGFPHRQVEAYPMQLPADYAELLAGLQATSVADPQQLLCPELLYQSQKQAAQPDWSDIDPRITWLANHLKQLKPEKVLVITADARTALDIARHLQQRSGLYSAVFHEGMSIIERDRAAAFFANQEEGSQVLICSEIGSEGRNFQFAHHLVLFDLPLNPDLLEQRIGRLDRIGQSQTIRIHVPYLENSAQAIMFHWYHEGLNAFEHTCPAGQNVFATLRTDLLDALHQINDGISDLAVLLETTRTLHQNYNAALQKGRDRLLEYSSCRPEHAARLVDQALEQTREKELAAYMDRVFDNFGIESEIHGHTSLVITPSEHVRIHLPGLQEDGMTITYHRGTALANEDMHFLSWEHPLVEAAMDNVINSEIGNTSMVTIQTRALPAGTLLLECLYNLASASSQAYDTSRFLPGSVIRIVIDQHNRQLQDKLTSTVLDKLQAPVKREIAGQVIKAHSTTMKTMLAQGEKAAARFVPDLLHEARQNAERFFNQEIDRLRALQTVNPNIRTEEIDYFLALQARIAQQLEASRAQLDAVRVIIVTD